VDPGAVSRHFQRNFRSIAKTITASFKALNVKVVLIFDFSSLGDRSINLGVKKTLNQNYSTMSKVGSSDKNTNVLLKHEINFHKILETITKPF
jgi:hypothetical protein